MRDAGRASVLRRIVALGMVLLVVAGCDRAASDEETAAARRAAPPVQEEPDPDREAAADDARFVPDPGPEDPPDQQDGNDGPTAHARPAWLGTRPLPLRRDGLGEVQPTPAELVDRRFAPPPGGLPAPADDRWRLRIGGVPDDVVGRSTWHDGCPVALADLRYLTFPFWGFDDRPHSGELLVHRDVAEGVGEVFRRLFEARFPLEDVRIVDVHELDVPPTGDGNLTTAFVCRSTVEGQRWSDHAFGTAIDLNPFHNPYVRGDVVIPELASAYVDRAAQRPGMIQPGDVVVTAFTDIGWGWGGNWQTAKDWMHFSLSGR